MTIKAGKNLKIIRKNFNKSQTEIADILGITLQRYNNYEKGRRKLPVDIGQKLANYFDLPLDAIFFTEKLFELLDSEDKNEQPA